MLNKGEIVRKERGYKTMKQQLKSEGKIVI